MSGTPFSSHEMKNGLVLKFVDESKKIAADRWYVRIRVTIDVPVDKKWFSDETMVDVNFDQVAKGLGDVVVFSQKKERNFVSDDKKEQVVRDVCARTLETGQAYLGSASFPAKFILKSFSERQTNPLA